MTEVLLAVVVSTAMVFSAEPTTISSTPVFFSDMPVVSTVAAGEPSFYTIGMEARRRGDHQAAKEAFLKLQENSPQGTGALEGLALSCLSLGQYDEAAGHLEKWNKDSPHSLYILGLLARAQRGARDSEKLRDTYLEIVDLAPYDFTTKRRLDDLMETRESGLLLRGRMYKSLGNEELNTRNPQRLVYEGRSGGLGVRVKMSPTWSLTAGSEVRQEAQRNDKRGFIYYDILEQIHSFGIEARPNRDLMVKAQYGQEVMSDNKVSAVGRTLFSRALLYAELSALDADFRLTATRNPYFLRGGAQSRFFSILRESALRGEAEWSRLGWDFLARASVYDYSEHTTQKNWLLQAGTEIGDNLIQPFYRHDQQQFYGALANGQIGYVNYDSIGLRLRRFIEDFYQVKAAYGYSQYRDGNRLDDISGDLKIWIPTGKTPDGRKNFSAGYRYAQLKFLESDVRYRAVNGLSHWFGIYWEPRNSRGLWALLGYEHGFLRDTTRRAYEGNAYLGEVEWYRRGQASLKAQGRIGQDNVGGQSYSCGFQARHSF